MKRNVGGADRIFRISIGALLVIATALGEIGPWGWLGLVPLATGLFANCPLYSLFGFNTCPLSNEP